MYDYQDRSFDSFSFTTDEDGKPRTTCKLTLSYDRRAVDEEESSKFLAALRHEIETVNEMTTGIYNVEAKKEALES
jgi:hypothetical protein